MHCRKCHNTIHFLGKITFRTICEACGISLHSCKQCKYYLPGKPNDCTVPGTEYVSDREQANFCEEFEAIQNKASLSTINASDIEKKLFKD